MKTICIRVDGNKEIATGHIGRCLSVARMFNSPLTENIIQQTAVIFIVSDENSKKILEERFEKTDNFEIVLLNTPYKDMEKELPALIETLDKTGCSCLLVDSYFVTENYLNQLHKALKARDCKLAYIDDLQQLSHYDTDVIINYGITDAPAIYQDVPTVLMGPSFTPLRAQFSNIGSKFGDSENIANFGKNSINIFISSGGIDSQNMSVLLINAILNSQLSAKDITLSFHVLTSRLNSHFEELISLSASGKNIHIYEGVSDVAGIMKQCDVAVSAGGTTLSELCAMGIPAISYLNADNQRKGIEEFARNEIIPYAGDVTDEKNKDAVIDNILKFINQFFNLPVSKQRDVSDKMRNYIDGQGACRIACELLK